jgi:hypothetical protein
MMAAIIGIATIRQAIQRASPSKGEPQLSLTSREIYRVVGFGECSLEMPKDCAWHGHNSLR